jgi:hypothetical protein
MLCADLPAMAQTDVVTCVFRGPRWAADCLEECLMALVVVMIHSEHLGAGYWARAEL